LSISATGTWLPVNGIFGTLLVGIKGPMNDPGVWRRVDLPIVATDLEVKVGAGGPATLCHARDLLPG